MTKTELYEYLNNPNIDYYTALRVSRQFLLAEPFKSRLLNYLLSQYKKFPKFTTTELMVWFINYISPIFSVTRFLYNVTNLSATTFYKALWADSHLHIEAINMFKTMEPRQIITTVDEQLQEVKIDETISEEERKKIAGQLRAQKMREAKARKREERLAAEQLEKTKQTNKTIENLHKNPSIILNGVQREMTDEETEIINKLKKLNV